MSFDTYYPSNPWAGVTTNQREWYDPILREVYYRNTIFSKYATAQFALAGAGSPVTTKMHITSLIPPHGNFNSLSLRQLWMPSSYIDSFEREIVFNRYGSKLALHKYDNLITYWKKNGNAGLVNIINAGLGQTMSEIMDALARNAFLEAPYRLYGGDATSIGTLESGDTLTTSIIDKVRVRLAERGVPFTVTPQASYQNNSIICITSPGVIHDLANEAGGAAGVYNQFVDTSRYADPSRIMRGEVGTYRQVRFIETPRATLRCVGPIVNQQGITAAVNQGDGATDDKVDNVRQVGQPDATNYITVEDGSSFTVNSIVAIHVSRTSANGVTNGVDWTDGKLQYRRIEKIDGNNISFDYPLMEDMTTDLGAGIYGYVTDALDVDMALFIGGMDGVVMGVGQPPRIHTPGPVDDFDSMYRISWDGYFAYQLFNPEVFELAFLAGTHFDKNE